MNQQHQLRPEQSAYAQVLNFNMKIALQALIITMIFYVVGVMMFGVSTQAVLYWNLPLDQYHQAVGITMGHGWSWLSQLNLLDKLSFFGIIYLASITIFCYARILPIFFKNKDYVYTCIAGIEILILLLAASGQLQVGGH